VDGEGLKIELMTSASVTAAPGSRIAVSDNGAAGGGEHLGRTFSNNEPEKDSGGPSGASSPKDAKSTTADEEEVDKPKIGPAAWQGK
jgi:hypothetical protein